MPVFRGEIQSRNLGSVFCMAMECWNEDGKGLTLIHKLISSTSSWSGGFECKVHVWLKSFCCLGFDGNFSCGGGGGGGENIADSQVVTLAHEMVPLVLIRNILFCYNGCIVATPLLHIFVALWTYRNTLSY